MELEKIEYRGYTIKVEYDEDTTSPREWCNVSTMVCKHPNYRLGDEHDVEKAVERLLDKHVESATIIQYFCKSRNAKFKDDGFGGYYAYKETWYDGSVHDADIDARGSKDEIAALMSYEMSLSEKLDLIKKSGRIVISPICMYEHGGITLWLGSTVGHPDAKWDCSTIGFSYVEFETAEKNGATKRDAEGRYNGYNSWQEWALGMMEDEMEVYDMYIRGEVFWYGVECDSDWEYCDSCGGFYGQDQLDLGIEEAKGMIDDRIEELEEMAKNALPINDKDVLTEAITDFVESIAVGGNIIVSEKKCAAFVDICGNEELVLFRWSGNAIVVTADTTRILDCIKFQHVNWIKDFNEACVQYRQTENELKILFYNKD